MGGRPGFLPRHADAPLGGDEAAAQGQRVDVDPGRLALESLRAFPLRRDLRTRTFSQRDRLAPSPEPRTTSSIRSVRTDAGYAHSVRRWAEGAAGATRSAGTGGC